MWSTGQRIRANEVRELAQRSDPPPVQTPGNQPPAPDEGRPTTVDALRFLTSVRREFQGNPRKYEEFLAIISNFRMGSLDAGGVASRVKVLLDGHPDLILGFNIFLPEEHKIQIQDGEEAAA